MKKTILAGTVIIFLILILLSVSTAATWCFQESANVSTQCGGLDTGIYLCQGSWHATQTCALTYDEAWNTYGDAAVGQTTYMYVNYTKPATTTNASWKTRIGNEGNETNTLPNTCWNQTTVQFKVELEHDDPAITGYCYNTTHWRVVASDLASPYLYEEGMNWDLTPEDTCTYVSGDWDMTDNCSITTNYVVTGDWTINSGGTTSIRSNITGMPKVAVYGSSLVVSGGNQIRTN